MPTESRQHERKIWKDAIIAATEHEMAGPSIGHGFSITEALERAFANTSRPGEQTQMVRVQARVLECVQAGQSLEDAWVEGFQSHRFGPDGEVLPPVEVSPEEAGG